MQEDARHYAASVLQHLQQTDLKDSFCCYGTNDSVLIGIGRAASLNLIGSSSLDSVWSQISEFITANSNEFIFGFIGFDPANQLNKKIESYQQKMDLFVPDTVIRCSKSGCKVIKGDANIEDIKEYHPHKNQNSLPIQDIDKDALRKQYSKSVEKFINLIEKGSLERATLARKIPTHFTFDLSGTFTANHSRHSLARSFYFSNPHIAFAGQSPELLAEGNTRLFSTHKLSGTQAKNNSHTIAEQISSFQSSPRIISEHQSAIVSIEKSLLDLGPLNATKFKVMELPTLFHGWSTFETRPSVGTSIANCLRAIIPYGVNPLEQGFELLAQHENFCRGPYYGLAGCITPDGDFSFTQVLRSVFRDADGSYLMAGAAITSQSTAEIETAETCTKLVGIQVFEKNTDI